MSRERMFALADRIVADLTATGERHDQGRRREGSRPAPHRGIRVLEDESKLEESIDQEVRRALSTYSRRRRKAARSGKLLYQKTRDEVYRRRFPAMKRVVVGLSGASGRDLRHPLPGAAAWDPDVEAHLVISDAGRRTIVEETDHTVAGVEALATRRYRNRDIGAALASGSFKTDGMVIVPCSIKTAARGGPLRLRHLDGARGRRDAQGGSAAHPGGP